MKKILLLAMLLISTKTIADSLQDARLKAARDLYTEYMYSVINADKDMTQEGKDYALVLIMRGYDANLECRAQGNSADICDKLEWAAANKIDGN